MQFRQGLRHSASMSQPTNILNALCLPWSPCACRPVSDVHMYGSPPCIPYYCGLCEWYRVQLVVTGLLWPSTSIARSLPSSSYTSHSAHYGGRNCGTVHRPKIENAVIARKFCTPGDPQAGPWSTPTRPEARTTTITKLDLRGTHMKDWLKMWYKRMMRTLLPST